MSQTVDPEKLDEMLQQKIDEMVEKKVAQVLEERLAALQPPKKKQARKVAIIASKGTLDMAYPPLILATAAAAMGAQVEVFFTFYGLEILRRDRNASLKVAPIGNPAMPVPVPNIVGMLPGMTPAATKMMQGMFSKHKVQTIPELLQEAVDLDVKLIGCQMTMDVMGVKKEDFIEGVEIGGAATFLKFAFDANVTLFI
ncbi:MAG TPA: DsrE/DsrF/DrsH-like family protein [Chloroflexia bacterium]|nr:DsrE/DsrF/DrsH-like family protein [Chloroflexia bacterium]